MYMAGAYIIEHLTNASFTDFINENIIQRLGMSDSTYSFNEADKSGIVADGFLSTAVGDPKGEGKRKIVYKPVPFFDRQGESSIVAGAYS